MGVRLDTSGPWAPVWGRPFWALVQPCGRPACLQVRYLQEDATEALAHIRMALKAAAGNATVDLPEGNAMAPHEAITLPGAACGGWGCRGSAGL